ncbi:MAG: Ig-like domain-containing protein [Caldilineaceae bacterium]
MVQGRSNTDNGGSIYNLGALILDGASILDSNVAADYSGGAIVSNGGAVTITDSRLENNTAGSAGGLYLIGESADATITNSIFRNNQTTNTTYGLGGAITTWDGADVTIRTSTLQGNQARRGGAIYNQFAATTITLEADTKLISNTTTVEGGGIYNYGGSVMLANSTVAGNTAPFGGGVRNYDGSVILTNSTVVSNTGATFGGGILNLGAIGLSNSTIAGNTASFGGGIYNDVITSVVTMTNSTVVSNTGAIEGGGIFNVGAITLTNGTVARNTAPLGGGVRNTGGNVTLSNSTVVSNTAATGGGGILNVGSLTVSNSTVAGNTAPFGGGVNNNSGSAIVTNSTVVSNTSLIEGGGIFNVGSVTVTNSTVAGNTASLGGGVRNRGGSVILTDSTVVSNTGATDGGGIFNFGAFSLSNSTVAGNTAPFGGGVRNGGGSVILTNSTVVSNTATNQGGGIYNVGAFFLTNGTVADNTAAAGGGIFNVDASSFVTLTNSIVANSLNSNDCSSTGTIVSQGYNLDSDNTCHFTATGDITSTNPLLGPLQANGGATFTRALLVGSPAIDHIPNGANGCGATMVSDQRGVVRPQGLGCDIGAFELVRVNRPPVANTQTVTTSVDTARAITLTGSDADNDALTYAIASNPSNGALSGTPPNMTYTPQAGFSGSDSFTFRVHDGTVDSDAAVVTIVVEEQAGSNHPPVANAQTVTTPADTAKAITLTGSDADNDTLTYAIVSNPSNGTLSGTPPNMTYTPKAGFNGSDSFTFRVHDGTVDSDAAVVTILVEEQGDTNHPPTAGADAVTTTVGVTITINVLANDADPDGDALTVTINQQPQHGSAVVNGVTIVYTPNAGFSGADSFSYTVTDSKGATASATITVTVEPQAEGATIYLPLVNR